MKAVLTLLGGIALAAVLFVLLVFGWPVLLVLAAVGLAAFLLLGFVMAIGSVLTSAGEAVLGSPNVKPAAPGEPSTAEWLEGFNARMAESEAAEEAARVQRRIDREKRIAEDRERKAQEEWKARKEELDRLDKEMEQVFAETWEICARIDKRLAENAEAAQQLPEEPQAAKTSRKRGKKIGRQPTQTPAE